MYLIGVYVPASHLETLKTAMFEQGAGKLGNYDCCSWQTKGTGQFRPLDNSSPFVGEKEKIHREEEYKLEMICSNDTVSRVIETLIRVHPYETPAYHVIKTTPNSIKVED